MAPAITDPEAPAPLEITARREIRCKACGGDSGLRGNWKRSPDGQLVWMLRKLGWACLHAGHLRGMDGDPRVWVCPGCQPTWRA